MAAGSFCRVEQEAPGESYSIVRVKSAIPEYVGTRGTRAAAQRLAEASAGRRLTWLRIRHELYERSDS